ncbi:rust resistance kinase Lr10-like isoform X3 [Triticum aestivum]|nr:rust resistance kinase Lr10-like isoform X3 [Triticum aestivum]
MLELAPPSSIALATFVNCSREVRNNTLYSPVACHSTSSSFVYVLIGDPTDIFALKPSCGYLGLAVIVLEGERSPYYANYRDVMESMRNGFAVSFPQDFACTTCGFEQPLPLLSIGELISGMKSRRYTWEKILELLLTRLFPRITGKYAYAAIPMWIAQWIAITAVLCRFMLPPLVVLTFLAYKYWRTRITIDAVEKFLRMQQMVGPIRYSYTDITAVTRHFRDKLGQGGYGSVYKGVLLPGDIHVAVKMLAGSSNCNGEDFISEVSTIGRIHHVNVVHLMGFCSEEMRRALIYEYMPNGSLDKYIFSSERSFSWDKLNEIALGIARGINYLHEGCDMQILHFDIKPHNILLDTNFVPKVADFGLAKLYPRDDSFVPLSAMRGTIGYIAPEMVSRSFGVVSSKSDVYSFGMLLLEMAGGRRNADPNASNSSQAYYPSWVYDRLTRQQEVAVISAADEMHELERKLCLVGLCCIQMKSQDRPTMSEAIEMLEGGVEGLHVPSRPFFCDDEHAPVAAGSHHVFSELTTLSEEEDFDGASTQDNSAGLRNAE